MSVERSFEAWEEVQRHGQDFADRLAQGFTGLIQTRITHPPAFPWPNPPKAKIFDLEFPELYPFGSRNGDFGLMLDHGGVNGVSAILDIGNRIGQAGFELGANLNGLVQQVFRRLPLPFKQEETVGAGHTVGVGSGERKLDGNNIGGARLVGLVVQEEVGLLSERLREIGFVDDVDTSDRNNGVAEGMVVDDEIGASNLKSLGKLANPQGTLNISSTFDSRTQNIESSLYARGDLWRIEASQGSSTAGNENSSLFLVQLGPVLFVRDTTLLLPVHLSKQHLLWYGYDRKNGLHSLCPTVWSKHRRWLFMSMLCLNPLTCSFVDLQFPNGQFTYVSGEGLSTSAFVPFYGGLLQVQGQYPGEMKFSYSHKNKWGTRIAPMFHWPDKSFSLGLSQVLAWQRTGLLVKPTVQMSLCPTFGGSNPGVRAEVVHSINEQLNVICGCAYMANPSLFASLSVGRSKWNGSVGRSGVVVRVDTPLSNYGRPSFSVQLNSGIEF